MLQKQSTPEGKHVVLEPGPDHPIETRERQGQRYVVRYGGELVADSIHALEIVEAGSPAVYYFPLKDVRRELLEKSDHTTHCPYKGTASYWSLQAGSHRSENAVWGYEKAHAAMKQLEGYVAFYVGKDGIELTHEGSTGLS